VTELVAGETVPGPKAQPGSLSLCLQVFLAAGWQTPLAVRGR
jgi:hypothetical protein